MRTSAITAAILAIATLTTSLSAQDDFSALLADLSFGDAPSRHEHLAVVEQEPAEDLKPISTGFTMPGMLESAPQVAPGIPQVALQDPIPATTPKPSDQIDLDAAFDLQDQQTTKTEVVGHIHNRCDAVPNCDSVITCTPHVAPVLPSSTFMQYFRSNKCYTHVWDGYHQNCGKNHKHLHGECDCFKNGSKQRGCNGSSIRGCNDCVSCDGGCDR